MRADKARDRFAVVQPDDARRQPGGHQAGDIVEIGTPGGPDPGDQALRLRGNDRILQHGDDLGTEQRGLGAASLVVARAFQRHQHVGENRVLGAVVRSLQQPRALEGVAHLGIAGEPGDLLFLQCFFRRHGGESSWN
jgi:hypothetical protein